MKRFLLVTAAILGAAGYVQAGAKWGETPRVSACPLLDYAGFTPIPFTQTWVRGGDTVEMTDGRVVRWRRLSFSADDAPARVRLLRRFGPPETERTCRLPNGETWRETFWRTPRGLRAVLRHRDKTPGAFVETVLETAPPAPLAPGAPLPAVPQPVMPGACRAAVVATLARCVGIDLPAPLAAAAWQGGEARGLAPLFHARGFRYRIVEVARDREVNTRTLQWFAAYNRRAARAGLPLLMIQDEGGSRLAWEESAADADPALAASLPIPDPAGLARFRQDIQTSIAAGLPLGWTLRRRTAGPRHRRLIIGFAPDTDRILALDLFPPYTPHLMPLAAAWPQTLTWQVAERHSAGTARF